MADLVMQKVAADNPAAQQLLAEKTTTRTTEPAPALATETPVSATTTTTDEPPAALPDGEDPLGVTDPNAQPPAEDPAEEIKPEDDAATQLKKLQASQKKLLKRLDKLTANNKEMQEREAVWLAEREQAALAQTPHPQVVLPELRSLEDVTTYEGRVRSYLEQLKQHARTGFTETDADGNQLEIEPAEVAERIAHWSGILTDAVPQRREFLKQQADAQTASTEQFAPWKERPAFKAELSNLDKSMAGMRNLMADYDLARHERALGRLVLSGGYTLMPKAKAAQPAAATGDAVPGRTGSPTPVPPSNPPATSGPPISPAGSGPNLAALRERMLKEPTNSDLAHEFVRATLLANRAA